MSPRNKSAFLGLCAVLALAALVPAGLGSAPAKKKARTPAERPSSNKAVIRTSDGTEFRGTVIDREDPLVTLKTADGEELHLPVEEIVSINGQTPQAYFKRFIPIIPESLFETQTVSMNPKVHCSFSFLSNWSKSGHPSGYIFVAPDEDRKWQGARFYFVLESPPKIPGELNYSSVIQKISDSGAAVTKEAYGVMGSTRTLFTTEAHKNGTTAKSIWQILEENGEKCLLQISLFHPDKDKLEEPIAKVLMNRVMASVRFKKP